MVCPTEQATTYSHDVAVASITRFYNFVKRIFGSWVGLQHPPEGGWPMMTPDLAEPMRLSPEAILVLRHIPQFDSNTPCVMHDCRPREIVQVFEYNRKVFDETGRGPHRIEDDWPEMDRGYPQHIFELASCSGYRYGTCILTDTKRGVAIWLNVDGRSCGKGAPEPDATPEDGYQPRESFQGWKSCPTFKIETFFAMAEEQLRLLNWLPQLDSAAFNLEELEVYGQPNEEQQERIKIMRDAGWPGENYDYDRAIEMTMYWDEARMALEEAEERMKSLSSRLGVSDIGFPVQGRGEQLTIYLGPLRRFHDTGKIFVPFAEFARNLLVIPDVSS